MTNSKNDQNLLFKYEAQKDYFTLIKAIKIVKNNNFKLFIYGEGSEKLKILNFINTNNLKNKVVMMGHENNKNKIYSNADLLIVSSIFEGLPNCVVEAINYNVPIIASNIGGNKEILNNPDYLLNKIEKKCPMSLAVTALLLNDSKSNTLEIISFSSSSITSLSFVFS